MSREELLVEIREIINKAVKAEQGLGRLNVNIPYSEEKLYKPVGEMYAFARESLADIASSLVELTLQE